jgi:IS30 family transposase
LRVVKSVHRKRRWREQRYVRVPSEVRVQIIRLAHKGATYRQIIERLDVSVGAVSKVLRPLGGVIRKAMYEPGPGRLSLDDRIEIYVGLGQGDSIRSIASRLGRSASTVCREVARNGGVRGYRPVAAHDQAQVRACRPKPTKLADNPVLCEVVIAGLERLWSPEQISALLRVEFPDDESMRVSHETIYKSLYVQGRGELRRELAACLRTGRAARKPRGRAAHQTISGKVMIADRPAEIDRRDVPGHWEGDLIIGKDGKSAIGTLVERVTRFVILLHLPNGHSAEEVRLAMTTAVIALPASLRRTMTWDQGTEMAQHAQFSIDTNVAVYFCDPHSPWQRGTNENTNGLLRQYFPKGTDLSAHTPGVLQAVADSLNTRPRKTLAWKTPAHMLNELVASAA